MTTPHSARELILLARQHAQAGQFPQAEALCRQALQIEPNEPQAHLNAGMILARQQKLAEAQQCFRDAVRLNPALFDAHSNLAVMCAKRGDLVSAICSFREAVRLRPDVPEIHHNLGNALRDSGDIAGAIEEFESAIRLRPDYADAHLSLGIMLLLSGQLEKGWKEYEWRWRCREFKPRAFEQPLWDGSDISGKTILLHGEQGFGDTIQFIRFAPLVAARGANVVVSCQPELESLVGRVKDVSVAQRGLRLPPFDVHCPLMSVPRMLRTTLQTIPADVPYLTPDPQRVDAWRKRLADEQGGRAFRVGLAWAGRPTHRHDRNRSLALPLLAPLASARGVRFYSLQIGPAAEQLNNLPPEFRVADLRQQVVGFESTAALISTLDLVISIDTVMAHLAGALGRRVWTLLSSVPDFRWMLQRTDSPWYPTMRLFRQQQPGDWQPVVASVAGELQALAKREAPSLLSRLFRR